MLFSGSKKKRKDLDEKKKKSKVVSECVYINGREYRLNSLVHHTLRHLAVTLFVTKPEKKNASVYGVRLPLSFDTIMIFSTVTVVLTLLYWEQLG